jgi:hypothetical protein
VRTVTTGHGPASITVTGVSRPLSASKTCVMPIFRPTIPFTPILLTENWLQRQREQAPL